MTRTKRNPLFIHLRSIRNHFEITLDELAVRVEISIGLLSRIERGYVRDIRNIHKRRKLEQYIRYKLTLMPNYTTAKPKEAVNAQQIQTHDQPRA